MLSIALWTLVALVFVALVTLNINYYRCRAAMTQEERDAEVEEFELSRGGW